jgi:CheY-like chemotaxis protein
MEKDNTVLLVEDSHNDIMLMHYAFKKADVQNPIVEVRDGQEAIEYLNGVGIYADRQRYPLPCLIITDLKMPRVDGFALLKFLKDRPDLARVPKLILSASNMEKDRNRAAELGACGYFVKPSGLDELVKVVSHLDDTWIADHCPA